ncbi:MAG: quinone-dependent dihydroorotate dehydrogenase [Rickettsiales bacterium]
MSLYRKLRPALFAIPPEQAHRAAICALHSKLIPNYITRDASLATVVAGLSFINPVGLAPGFDKNAECFEGALHAGCGFVEIGTVTPRAQPGNPTPRVFRLVDHEAIINRLGFNNQGMDAAAKRLAKRSGRGIIGGNIGKNKESVDAAADYIAALRTLYPHVDYITANISSPNTPGLRALQASDELHALITALQTSRSELVDKGATHRPIFVKIAPDCDDAMLQAIAETTRATSLDGLIISNTTLARDAIASSIHASETGGLSGKPLFASSTELLRKMYRLTEGTIPLIGVGGINSAEEAYEKIRAGASLVQLYTALVYQGFGLIGRINDGLAGLLKRDGFDSIAKAVGTAN